MVQFSLNGYCDTQFYISTNGKINFACQGIEIKKYFTFQGIAK
jgi:hypothetical protein